MSDLKIIIEDIDTDKDTVEIDLYICSQCRSPMTPDRYCVKCSRQEPESEDEQ